jgi:hypothetical protein
MRYSQQPEELMSQVNDIEILGAEGSHDAQGNIVIDA